MKKKILLLIAVATLGLTAATIAQVPNYVPTNGLVGWWPFNGNANDESGNGNNGVVYNATADVNRFNQQNSALFFNGINSGVELPSNVFPSTNGSYSLSAWFKLTTNTNQINGFTIFDDRDSIVWDYKGRYIVDLATNPSQSYYQMSDVGPKTYSYNIPSYNWVYLTCVYNSTIQKMFLFKNGVIADSSVCSSSWFLPGNRKIQIGRCQSPLIYNGIDHFTGHWNGQLDDIGIWDRALTQQEITNLYTGVNCGNNTNISPQTNSLVTGSIATFNATTTDPNPSYVWQSDFGQGFQTLNNFGNYSGANTNILSIANLQLAQHNLPIRVITTSGSCVDTSNVATISITDTCINTIIDTNYISVTDTLIINTSVTGINPPNNLNTIRIFPNPASTHITIDYGNFAIMNGYQLKITNSLGQQMFQTAINQQSNYVSLASWGGNGLYFVHIIDPQGNTLDIRKIILQ